MCVCVCSYAFAFGGRGSLSTLVLLVMLASGGEFVDAMLPVSLGFKRPAVVMKLETCGHFL